MFDVFPQQSHEETEDIDEDNAEGKGFAIKYFFFTILCVLPAQTQCYVAKITDISNYVRNVTLGPRGAPLHIERCWLCLVVSQLIKSFF